MPRQASLARLWLDKGRDVWCILDSEGGRRIKVRTRARGDDRRAAEVALAEYVTEREARRRAEEFASPAPDDPTTSDPARVSIDRCLAHYGMLKDGTPNAVLTGVHITHLLRHCSGKTLAQVRGQTCRDYVAARTRETFTPRGAKTGRPVSAATARRELETLSAAIGAWHREYTLTARPQVTLPERGEAHPDWLTDREYESLLKVARGWRRDEVGQWHRPVKTAPRSMSADPHFADPALERFLEIGFATGTRAAAILSLGWKPDRVRGWIDIPSRTLHRSGPDAIKTRKRQPPCRIPERLIPVLERWRAEDEAAATRAREEGRAWDDRVVHRGGRAIAEIDRAFATAVERAGLRTRDIDGVDRLAPDGPGMPTPHILRHSRVTLLLRAGIAPHDVGEYVGMSVRMVTGVYGHHHVEYQRAAADAA